MKTSSAPKIALVLKGYPRLSETFIAQEILELERAGFDIEIISLRHPTDRQEHPVHQEIKAPRRYLPEYLYQEPLRVGQATLKCIAKPGFWSLVPIFVKDLMRDPSPNRCRRFGQALVLATEFLGDRDLVYVHFLHTPGSVARYASIISGKPFSISAHAKDIWTIPEWEIREKLADCEWLVTCTRSGAEYLTSLSVDKVHLVYHGLDLDRFPDNAKSWNDRDGKSQEASVRLCTVGRAVAKKGIDTLLEALALLPADLNWQWTHIGGGPLRQELIAHTKTLGIDHRCQFMGALPQSEVLETYLETDIFILPSRIDKNGDRDGLPNVIVEAQSQGIAVIATNISGIPELIEDGVNGLLVDPDDITALQNAILKLAIAPELRGKMGMAGNAKVRSDFSHTETIGRLVDLLNLSVRGKNS